MTPWALAIIAVSLLGYAAVSRRLAGTLITAAMVFVGIGLLFGPRALDGLDAPPTGHSVRLLAEATLTLVLFLDASRIDLRALRREYAVPARLLGIGLPLTIVAGTVAAAALFSGLTLIEAVVVGILLAPTDAALGQAVVTLPEPALADPPGPQRRERPQRRDLRAPAPDRARRRRDPGRRDDGLACDHRRGRGDRVRAARRPRRGHARGGDRRAGRAAAG